MGAEVLSAKLDIIFKKLFTENPDLLESMLGSFLNIPESDVEIVEYINAEIVPGDVDEKFCCLDLSVKLRDQLVNIEIQIRRDAAYRERALFYWAKLYTSQLKSGESYHRLKRTISIHLLDFNYFEHPGYHTEVAAVQLQDGRVFSDKFSMHFIEFKKALQISEPGNMLEFWLQFFNVSSKEELIMLEKSSVSPINKAARVMLDYSRDGVLREIA
ncbi:MAG: Rpn family recombination-promoting nuclease/putative transposase, partial [Bradymonadia bacterium]